ncbi:VOC family protein [Gordonia desulfuricans]|uniref:VOC family protein n=1 Tax=Gordonia desulfuricans TaxID=89051 RepID=A0A7K3LWI1_9ACTN|nr:VOC family protein [Gordonia desulfuricans]NDK91907.1 VOC family protein [Gordonia desulfuricans]
MQIRWLTAFLDFTPAEFGDEVTFWRAIAGSTVSPPRGAHREFATLEPFNGDAHLRVQRIQEGPGGVHLDLHVDDPHVAATVACAAGAVTTGDHGDHLTLTSPGGLPFCLVAWNGSARRSRPIRWPEDTISIIDQVCMDVPDTRFERELNFWQHLTGRPAVSTSRPELVALERDRGLAIGILLQRLDVGAPDSTTTAHLDLATTSVDDEITRHEGWGATVVERFEHWTVMRDPAGRRYCITDRNPRTGE